MFIVLDDADDQFDVLWVEENLVLGLWPIFLSQPFTSISPEQTESTYRIAYLMSKWAEEMQVMVEVM